MKQLSRINRPAETVAAGIFISLLLLVSCSQDRDGIPGGATRASLVVEAVSTAGDGIKANTRVPVLPVAVTTGSLWVGIRGTNGYVPRTGLVYSYGGGAWIPAPGTAAVLLGKDPISLYAYWPQAGYAERGGTVTLNTRAYADAEDLCYALSGGGNVCSAHPSAGFVLSHAYARLKVDIGFSALLAGAATLDAVCVSGGGFYTDGTLVLENGFLVPGLPLTEVRWATSGQTMQSIAWKYTDDMLVVPSASVTGAGLSIRINGINYVASLGNALTRLEAGKQYRIKAEVKVDPTLVISKVEVEDWMPGGSHAEEVQFE